MIPDYLKKYVRNVKEKKDSFQATLVSSAGNESFEILYYGKLENLGGKDYIAEGKLPCLIVARDPVSREEIVLFDGAKHGYDNLFCNAHDRQACKNRPLQVFGHRPCAVEITLGYSIDYEEEREEYAADAEGNAVLVDGSIVPFATVKQIGYDFISLKFVEKKFLGRKKTEFFEAELA